MKRFRLVFSLLTIYFVHKYRRLSPRVAHSSREFVRVRHKSSSLVASCSSILTGESTCERDACRVHFQKKKSSKSIKNDNHCSVRSQTPPDYLQARLIPIEWRQFSGPCRSCSHTVDPRDCPFTHLTASSTTSVTSTGDTAYVPIALRE